MCFQLEDCDTAFEDIRFILSYDNNTPLKYRIYESVIKRLTSLENGRSLMYLTWDLPYNSGLSCPLPSLLKTYRLPLLVMDLFLNGVIVRSQVRKL